MANSPIGKFSVAVDYLTIGPPPVVVPADKTTLSPPHLRRNFHVTEGFGVEGSFCSYTGEGLAEFDATFEFWNAEKEALWDVFANTYLKSPSRNPLALSIHHPVLVKPPFNIQNVQVTNIEGWSLVSPGRWQTKISFLQYRAQKPFVPMKTEPNVPAVAKVVPEKPKTAQDFRMANHAARLAHAGTGATSLDSFKPPYPGY